MGIIYQILRNFRILFYKSKKIKKILTIVIIIFLFYFLYSKVFGYTEEEYQDNLNKTLYVVEYVKNQIYSAYNIDVTTGFYMLFEDVDFDCFRCVYAAGSSVTSAFGIYEVSDWGDYDVKCWLGRTDLYCFTINKTSGLVSEEHVYNTGNSFFSNLFNYDCFNRVALLYCGGPSTWGGYTTVLKPLQENYYITKPTVIMPFEEYNGNSFNIDGNFVLNPRFLSLWRKRFF